MNHPVLNAAERTLSTKGELHSLRRQGKIPAVVYGGGQSALAIVLDAKEFKQATAGISESTIISLNIGGNKKDAFIRERQRDTMSTDIIHVDFLEVAKDRALRAKVSLHFTGVPVGVKEGGILETPGHEVEVECLPADLPERIEIDVSALEANHSIHVRDIPAMKNVKILTSSELVLAVVKYAKAEAEPEVVEAAVPAEGAVPVEGAVAADGTAPVAGAAPAAAAPAAGGKAEKKEGKK